IASAFMIPSPSPQPSPQGEGERGFLERHVAVTVVRQRDGGGIVAQALQWRRFPQCATLSAPGRALMHRLSLSILPDRLAICRLPPESAIPAPPAGGSLWSVTRTADELSSVLPEAARLPDWQAETGWRAFRVDGTLDFGLTGIMASLTTPLAGAGVSLFTVSTW